jgi:hypothetical protein
LRYQNPCAKFKPHRCQTQALQGCDCDRVAVSNLSIPQYDPPVSANNGIKFGAKESAPCLAGAAAGFAALQNTHGLFDRSPSDIAVSLQL